MSNTTSETAVKTYAIDPTHSRFGFSVRHMGFSKVRGHFEEIEGTVHANPDDLSATQAEAKAKAASINTNEKKRDEHLRSGDFLLADEHPEITFTSKGVKDVSGNSFTLTGDLTIRGETKQVDFDAEFLGEGQDPWGGTRVAFEAETEISRKEFGVTWNQVLEAGGVLVGDKVTIELEVQAVEQDG